MRSWGIRTFLLLIAAVGLACALPVVAQDNADLAIDPPGLPATQPVPDEQVKAMNAITHLVMTGWNPNCDAAKGKQIRIEMDFSFRADGYLTKPAVWANPYSDATWIGEANRAKEAIRQILPFEDLPASMQGIPIRIVFDTVKACRT